MLNNKSIEENYIPYLNKVREKQKDSTFKPGGNSATGQKKYST